MFLPEYVFPRLHRNPARNILPFIPEGRGIPRVIHQTFPNVQLPSPIQASIAAMRALNPTWEYRFYDDSDIVSFIQHNYGARILGYYNRINPKYGPARADLFRYLLVYRCGGAYFDIKSSPARALDDVLLADDSYLLSCWSNQPESGNPFKGWGFHPELRNIEGGEFQQWHIVATPGHPFLRAVIEHVLGNIDSYNPDLHGTGQIGVLRVTGPIAYTLAIAPLLHLHPHRFASNQDDLGFRYSIFPVQSQSRKSIFTTHYTTLTEPVVEARGAETLLVRAGRVFLGSVLWRRLPERVRGRLLAVLRGAAAPSPAFRSRGASAGRTP